MATIEERANKSFENYKGINECDYYTDGYIQGAADQRRVDIDKACEWIKENSIYYVPSWEDGITRMDECLQDFRKAMEE